MTAAALTAIAVAYERVPVRVGIDLAAPEIPVVKPKVLIIGHGGHGKDAVAEILRDQMGFRVTSSSQFCAEKAVYPLMADLYPDAAACYADRRNHRSLWFHAIRAYNLRPGPSLAEQIFVDHDLYVGMRSRAEFDLSRGAFDLVIWVDASDRVPPEDPGSMELTPQDADWVIDNNGPLEATAAQIWANFTG